MNFKSQCKLRNEGFTLIEVLISLAILMVISLSIYQAITGTYRLRESLTTEGDFYNSVRLSMGLLERDFSQLYSPIVMMPEKEKKNVGNPNSTQPRGRPDGQSINQPGQPELSGEDLLKNLNLERSDFWGDPLDNTGIRPSRFIGTETKISFISSSNIRVYKETPESELTKITYELVPERSDSELPKDWGSKVLLKTASTNVYENDEKRDKMKKTYPLLHGVTKIKYRYFDRRTQDWARSWDSDSQDYKNRYPEMLEIEIEVKGQPRLHFEGKYKFRPELPLRALDSTI